MYQGKTWTFYMQCFFGKAFKLGLIKYNSMNKVFSVISHMYVCQAIRVQTTYVTVIQYIIMQRLLKIVLLHIYVSLAVN